MSAKLRLRGVFIPSDTKIDLTFYLDWKYLFES
jgi:hypothetical protein